MKLRGIVKGRTIVFDETLDLPDGQSVEAEVRPIKEEPLERYGFRPIPAGGNPVTNEMVNELREELGI